MADGNGFPLRVVMVAPPGAGKGTQAALIARRWGVPHIATGDLMRRHIAQGTPLGQRVRTIVADGGLVPDEIVLDMIRTTVADSSGGYILDGFPRTVAQAVAAEGVLGSLGLSPHLVLHLAVGRLELVRRLLGRATKENRPDDDEVTIERRIAVYEAETVPVLRHYRDLGLLSSLDGEQPVEELSQDIDALLRKTVAAGPAEPQHTS